MRNHSIPLFVESIKSHTDSFDPKIREYTAVVSVIELAKAQEISTDANPRHQNLRTAVTKNMRASLETNDGKFRYKNQGITINCKSLDIDNDSSKPVVIHFSSDPDDLNGIINGGHTNRVIRESYMDLVEEQGQSEADELLNNQTVLCRFFTGINDREAIVDIAEGQNSSVSVTKESFLHMNKEFDSLIKVLPSQWEEEIAFKMNEVKDNGDPFIFDSRDLLGYIWITNSDKFPTSGYDKLLTRAYSSKSSLVNAFEKEEQKLNFRINKGKMEALLEIRDYVLSTAEKLYNENYNENFGNLRISEKFSKSDVKKTWGSPRYTLNRGGFLPILSSFRRFEEKGEFNSKTMRKAWDEEGHKLIRAIYEISSQRESITEIGKDSVVWNTIAKEWNDWISDNLA